MGDFGGKRWRPYLDEETQKIRDEKLDHLKRNYEGPTDFLKQKLKEEKVLDIEERIQKLESEIDDKKEDVDKLRRIKNEREQQDKLRDKKELLKQKQEKLRKLSNRENKSEEEIREQVKSDVFELCQDKAEKDAVEKTANELFESERYQRRIQQKVEKQLEDQGKVDELVEDVQRLQRQVKELNGGREDWFMDLGKEQNAEVQA